MYHQIMIYLCELFGDTCLLWLGSSAPEHIDFNNNLWYYVLLLTDGNMDICLTGTKKNGRWQNSLSDKFTGSTKEPGKTRFLEGYSNVAYIWNV